MSSEAAHSPQKRNLAEGCALRTSPHERRERALTCLFLNRSSYSGIINRRSGPIGGQAQTSRYPIDCRFPRDTLIERIKHLNTWSERVAFVLGHAWDGG